MKKRSIITLVVVFGALFIGLVIFIGVMVAVFAPDDVGVAEDSIGVVELEGSIGHEEAQEFIEDLDRWLEDDGVEAILIRVNSPGGSIAPSQEMYYALQRAGEQKPVAVSMSTVAASGGYYIACGSDHIVANPGTITGSIGVITQFVNLEDLVETLNMEVYTITSGDYKDSGSPFREFKEADEELFTEMIFDFHDQFLEHVALCRDREVEEIAPLAQGQVYTGRQAYENDLVDDLGTMQDVVDHLADQAGVEDPELVYPPEETLGVFGRFVQAAIGSSITEIKEQNKPRVTYEYPGPQ